MAITDHGSLAGIWAWHKACAKHGIKAIPGIEAVMETRESRDGAQVPVIVLRTA